MFLWEGSYRIIAKLKKGYYDKPDESHGKNQKERGKKEQIKKLVGVIADIS